MSDEPVEVLLPSTLRHWAKERGLGAVAVHISDIALSVTLELPPDSKAAELWGQRESIRHLADVVRAAGREARMPWPLVFILDATMCIDPPDQWPGWHSAVDALANNQDWHRGDLSLYLLPLVPPDTEWRGPTNADELRRLLLSVGAQVEHLPKIKAVTLDDLRGALNAARGGLPAELPDLAGLITAAGEGAEALKTWTKARLREVASE